MSCGCKKNKPKPTNNNNKTTPEVKPTNQPKSK